MRRLLLLCAAVLPGVVAEPALAADLVLTGNVSCGTYTNIDDDIYIYDATLVAGPGGTTTLTLRAHNGRIYVGRSPGGPQTAGINGKGADGGTSADGGTGFNVILETTGVALGPSRLRDIIVDREINCSGGDGGDGAPGADGFFLCGYTGATPATDGGDGGDGGDITITGVGPISISDKTRANGGAGGNGGNGGNGIAGTGHPGGSGGTGGAGGTITISNAAAPAGSLVSLYTGGTYVGSVLTDGGLGGHGGDGGHGDPAMDGGAGGGGGAGGPITIGAKAFTMSAVSGECAVSSSGAAGGTGGNGGAGRMSGCVPTNCPPPGDPTAGIDGAAGGNSGAGGSGGPAAPIVIVSSAQVGLGLLCEVRARGGTGNIAGLGGQGGLEKFGGCNDGLCTLWTLLPPGITADSGGGGHGAAISVTCTTFSLAFDALSGKQGKFSSSGGNGADGIKAAIPANYCCGLERIAGEGAAGGAGGDGGNGAPISIKYTTYSAPGSAHYAYCGGLGRRGGNGSEGFPVGVGGPGGSCGAAGSLTLNTTVQPNPCGSCTAPDGDAGVNHYPPCIQP